MQASLAYIPDDELWPTPENKTISLVIRDPVVSKLEELGSNFGLPLSTIGTALLRSSEAWKSLSYHPEAPFPVEPIVEQVPQRPASFRFGLADDGKIHSSPTQRDTIDDAFARDTYSELKSKAQALQGRLGQSNSSARAIGAVNELLAALGSVFENFSPGVGLSKSRRIEEYAKAFDSEEGHKELYPDAIADMNDVLQSLQDLLAVFPIVREIERERIALRIETNETVLAALGAEISEIKRRADQSPVVSESAVAALRENDTAIEEALTIEAKANLVADQVLTSRNFVSVIASAIGEYATQTAGPNLYKLGAECWEKMSEALPQGVGQAAQVTPILGVLMLAGYIEGSVGTLATLATGFGVVASNLSKVTKFIRQIGKEAQKAKPKAEKKPVRSPKTPNIKIQPEALFWINSNGVMVDTLPTMADESLDNVFRGMRRFAGGGVLLALDSVSHSSVYIDPSNVPEAALAALINWVGRSGDEMKEIQISIPDDRGISLRMERKYVDAVAQLHTWQTDLHIRSRGRNNPTK